MTLRLRISLLVGVLTAAFVALLLGQQLRAARATVHEEVVAANRVAAQLLARLAATHAGQGGLVPLQAFLQGIGRVRSTEITLVAGDGAVVYRSPPSAYKAGRAAPPWFEAWIVPALPAQVFAFPTGRLEMRANPSRAALDAWDELRPLALVGAVWLVVLTALLAWAVGRATRPFARIVGALNRLEAGDFDAALPALPGREAAAIAQAFNRMTAQLRGRLDAERRAAHAEARLAESRELARWVDRRLEEERRSIARELHDEFGQTVTALRAMALAIAQRTDGVDATSADAARHIEREAARLYDAMHGVIPRLAPLVLDAFGLQAALDDLVERTRAAHPGVAFSHAVGLDATALDAETALALFRAAQEGVTNALRHGGARTLRLRVQRITDARPGGACVMLTLDDDGRGLPDAAAAAPGAAAATASFGDDLRVAPPDRRATDRSAVDVAAGADAAPIGDAAPPARAHHGLRWLRERAEGLGGTLKLTHPPEGGARLTLVLPALADASTRAAAAPTAPPGGRADGGGGTAR